MGIGVGKENAEQTETWTRKTLMLDKDRRIRERDNGWCKFREELERH